MASMRLFRKDNNKFFTKYSNLFEKQLYLIEFYEIQYILKKRITLGFFHKII